jgi:hypothetical protein
VSDVLKRATDVLVEHQRYDIGSCLCGWNPLGASHAMHQAEKLREAGLLKEES